MNKTLKYTIAIILVILAVTGFILFEVVKLKMVQDDTMNSMLGRSIYYFLIATVFIWLQYILSNSPYMSIKSLTGKTALWCLPCLLVILANFPFGALIKGQVTINRPDLIWLYIIYVIGISLVEEIVFRGVLLFLLLDIFKNHNLKYFLSALISSAVFALFHLTNIFAGMDIGSVLLQSVYTFLIGGMLSVVAIKTKNIWMGVIIHAAFDFGGLMTTTIATGDPWDVVFWILTISCGILCAGHIIYSLFNMERKHVS